MWNKFKSIFSKPSEKIQTSNDNKDADSQVNENPPVSQCPIDIGANNCTQEETIEQPISNSQDSVTDVVIDEDYPLLAKTISKIVSEFGKNILFDKKLLNIIADYRGYTEIAASKKIFETLFKSDLYNTIVSADESTNMTNLCHKVSSVISEQNGYKEELVWDVVVNLLLGLHKVDIAFISSNKSDASELQIVIEKILYGDSQELPQPYNPTSELANYIYPDVTFHTKYAQDIYLPNSEINQNIECILNILAGFDIKAEFIGVDKGHIVSVYKFTVDATKQVKLQRNVKEISSFIRPNGIRIYSSFNSLGEVNIEIPNNEPSFVSDTPVVPQEEDIIATFGELPGGKPFRVDLTDLGHIAIFGDMGTGKTALLDNILMSLLMSKHPAYIKFIVFSNSVLDFTYIDRLKNIFGIETSAGDLKMSSSAKAETIMRAISFEIDHRIQLLRTANCPCITDYNRLFCNHGLKPTDGHHYLPYIIVVIDEIQDYMGINGCNLETLITSVLPNALNVGCIFIVTTKYTNRKTISIFNQYFSTKVAFNMSQFNIDNANSLMSHNDALLHNKDNITRFQPTIFSDTLRDYIVEHIAMQQYFATPKPYILSESTQNSSSNNCIWDRMDDKFKDAARIVVSSNLASVSTSTLQRYMGIGYNKAGKIMDQLEVAGIVGPTSGGKPRAVLVDSTQLEQILSKY